MTVQYCVLVGEICYSDSEARRNEHSLPALQVKGHGAQSNTLTAMVYTRQYGANLNLAYPGTAIPVLPVVLDRLRCALIEKYSTPRQSTCRRALPVYLKTPAGAAQERIGNVPSLSRQRQKRRP